MTGANVWPCRPRTRDTVERRRLHGRTLALWTARCLSGVAVASLRLLHLEVLFDGSVRGGLFRNLGARTFGDGFWELDLGGRGAGFTPRHGQSTLRDRRRVLRPRLRSVAVSAALLRGRSPTTDQEPKPRGAVSKRVRPRRSMD